MIFCARVWCSTVTPSTFQNDSKKPEANIQEWMDKKREKSEREGKDGVIRNNLGKEKKKDWNKIFKDVRKRPLC